MATWDSIIVGEDWISEHFFTSDGKQSFAARVLERSKAWKDADEPIGTPLSRFTQARGRLEKTLVDLDLDKPHADAAHAFYTDLRAVLGYDGAGYAVAREGDLTRVSSPGLTGAAPLAILEAVPALELEDLFVKDREGLFEDFESSDGSASRSLPKRLSTLLVGEDGPQFVLALAGRWILVAERERWAEGRYLAIDIQLVAERNDTKRAGEVETALTCLSAESLAPNAEGDIWWKQIFEESVQHTVGVSKDLRDGVRHSIEIIANEVVVRRALKGLDPLPQSEAQPLAKQSLRYLYRILFLLFAEASPELGVLPVGTPEYEAGYSLGRLRDLTLAELTTQRAREGTHLYQSLGSLFRLVDRGHRPTRIRAGTGNTGGEGDEDNVSDGLTFRSLRADLFLPRAVAHIDEVGLGNLALKSVLELLLLSKETSKQERGFISYAELGINQLGAVYEGLMSYTGFFAEEDLYEVAKNGDRSKGSWVVPVARASGIDEMDFVRQPNEVGEEIPVLHPAGTFVFRLAGRERQQSASYYTPEVLTRFTVSQALEELLDQDGETTSAEQILSLTVCEPALGSGAFAIEATRQLAAEYLTRRQKELGEKIEPEEYQRELQRAKAYIALHNVYGVDLNATAVELAEISLWLDTMVEGLDAPWFGLHLRRGNSLIGARRAVYSRASVNDKSWLKNPPRDIPMSELAGNMAHGRALDAVDGSIHHFLLPAEGWGSATESKEAKELAPDAHAALKAWRNKIRSKPSKKQVEELNELSYRVEVLWQVALRRLEIAEAEARRSLPVWGREEEAAQGAVTREAIEASLADANGAYRRLRRVMDAWCALWFWPLTDTGGVEPPTLEQWIDACQRILGRAPEARARGNAAAGTLASTQSWDELNATEETELGLAGAEAVERVLERHPWLRTCSLVADRQGFFHWDFDFAAVMSHGGFDLQLGNPPWVRPTLDIDALLAEGDPWWQLAVKPSEVERADKRQATLSQLGVVNLVVDGTVDVAATAEYVGAPENFPGLVGLQPDLYRCFMLQTWRHSSAHGTAALIHPDTHFTDEKAGPLRSATYPRLRRHWQFINELQLFEIGHPVRYGVHIYGPTRERIGFDNAASLYHPSTVERSYHHDGSGEEPGLKDSDGNWDLRPHRTRVIRVDSDVLKSWHRVLEDESVPVNHTRMLYSVNRSVATVLDKIAAAPRIIAEGLSYSPGWHEKNDRTKGHIVRSWGPPDSWNDVILQGPHIHVSTPVYKTPNATMFSKGDWSLTDFESLPADAIPATSFKPSGDPVRYAKSYTHWGDLDSSRPARDYYRVAWRRMAAHTNERTLIPALIPPGCAHVDGIFSAGGPELDSSRLATILGVMSSLVADLLTRSAPKGDIRAASVSRLPLPIMSSFLQESIQLRVLRLNCLTIAYSGFWRAVMVPTMQTDRWTKSSTVLASNPLGSVRSEWTTASPLRTALARRQALLEIDALVALALEVTADELCGVYRTQFAVLRNYDNERLYDANGRLVPREIANSLRVKGEALTVEERIATNPAGNTYTYEFPFDSLDREHDMRVAYAEFERRLHETST